MRIDQEKLLGFIIALVTAVVTWTITGDLLSSFLVGLVTQVLALLLEIQMDISKTQKVIYETQSISAVAVDYQPLRQLITDFDMVIKRGDPILKKEAERTLFELAERMANLGRGRFTIKSYEDAYIRAVDQLESIKKEAYVTDIVTNPNKWAGGEVHAWHEANLKAAQAGLKITRIFIVKEKEFLAPDSPLRAIMKAQNNAGINVRYATFDDLESDLIRDCGLLDHTMVVSLQFGPTGKFESFTYDFSPAVINETRDYFGRITARSHPFINLPSLKKTQKKSST